LKGRGVSANPGEVRTRASSASERAQRVAGAETAEGFQLFPLTPPLETAYLNTTDIGNILEGLLVGRMTRYSRFSKGAIAGILGSVLGILLAFIIMFVPFGSGEICTSGGGCRVVWGWLESTTILVRKGLTQHPSFGRCSSLGAPWWGAMAHGPRTARSCD